MQDLRFNSMCITSFKYLYKEIFAILFFLFIAVFFQNFIIVFFVSSQSRFLQNLRIV